MTARDQMTKLLDQLMGQNRDGEDMGREKHFTDKDVCKPFLLGICINDLFVNTRAELPECTKVHSVTLKDQFEEASKRRDYRIEEEVYTYLQSFLKDNERKIETAKKRLTATQETPEMEEKVEQIHELAVQVGEKVAKAEALGAEGKVDESLAMMGEVEEIKGKKKALEDEYHAAIPRHAAQQQKLRACEVCGAFLSMYDNDRRLADHFGGKLHIGFVTIRDKIKQLEETIQAKEEKRMKEREEYSREREEREKERSKRSRSGSRERRRRRSRSRSKERDRDRRRESYRERDGYRDRDRDRGRGRDRNRGRRSRSRSKERSSRKERRSKSRSRSRERRRRERSES